MSITQLCIYKVRGDNPTSEYEFYDGAIIIAESHKEAKKLFPKPYFGRLISREIGIANKTERKGIILSSFING